jgi:uncharacterized membrane protein YkoI
MKSANVKNGLTAALMGALFMHGALAQFASPAEPSAVKKKAQGAKVISEEDAKQIAVKAVPGKVIDIAIEKKLGANRYVVEVQPEAGGKELDVVINMTSGKVLAIEK